MANRNCCASLLVALSLSPQAVAALSFDITYIDQTGALAARGWLEHDSLFQQNIRAAAETWGRLFASDETIVLDVDDVSYVARAGGQFSFGRFLYVNAQGKQVWETGPLSRILTGDNPGEDFYGFDIRVGFDAQFVDDNYWFDPQPELRTAPVPADKGDFLSVVLHELGHGFGIAGNRDPATGEISGNTASQMDDLSYFGGNGNPIAPSGMRNPMFFGGDIAASVYGSDLPLTHKPEGDFNYSQNFYHLSACDSGSPDGLEGTLMNGCVLPSGERLSITPFDAAVYADLGYPLALDGDFNGDGDVDAAVYVVWRDGLGPIYTQAHYELWRANFGRSRSGAAAQTAVPEPMSCLLLTGAAVASLLFRRSRRHQARCV